MSGPLSSLRTVKILSLGENMTAQFETNLKKCIYFKMFIFVLQ